MGEPEPSDYELCQRHKSGKAAMSQLITRHAGLARTWARRMQRREQCCSIEDLNQEANRGLIDAAEHFDPGRGAFSTCASLWIRKRIFAIIEKAKQFGPQVEELEPEDKGRTQKDYSPLLKSFSQIEKLHKAGLIDDFDLTKMRAICSPLDIQDELLRPIFAAWWHQAKSRTLLRVARAAQVYRAQKRSGKVNLDYQREMWAR